ncbi:MAG: hypothetical protein GYB64_18035 [Chloroflexi bacterium]|nr:hypothetical protein [Chloroflexota bacterium]
MWINAVCITAIIAAAVLNAIVFTRMQRRLYAKGQAKYTSGRIWPPYTYTFPGRRTYTQEDAPPQLAVPMVVLTLSAGCALYMVLRGVGVLP